MVIVSQILFWSGVAYIWIMGLVSFFRAKDKKPQTSSAKTIESFKILFVGMGLMLLGMVTGFLLA